MRDYLLGILAAAAILGIITAMTGPKSTAGGLVKLIGGLYLMFVVIQPLARFDFDALSDYARQELIDGTQEAAIGQKRAQEAMARIIKQECESYIMDKASEFSVKVRADVSVSGDDIPVPVSVTLSGMVTSYEKAQMERIIEKELNIPKEKQIWTGST